MKRWRSQYSQFTGPRYPSLVGYAQLLALDNTRANELVAFALRRTFGRWRRQGTAAQTQAQLRRLIVTRFLATAGPEKSADTDVTTAPDPAANAPKPVDQIPIDLSIYAPPGESTTSRARAVVHTESAAAPGSGASQTAVPTTAERDSASPCAERPGGSEVDQTHAALAALSPRARAITVLRHYDGLWPETIAEYLGLSPDQVVRELRASHDVLRAQLGIHIGAEPNLRAAANARATPERASAAQREVTRSIVRSRALHSGAFALGAAVIIGTGVLVGLEYGRGDLTHPPVPTPTPLLTVVESLRDYATVPLPDDDYPMFIVQPLPLDFCGKAAPAPLALEDDFSVEFNAPETFDFGQSTTGMSDNSDPVTATVSFHGEEPTPVFAGALSALIVQDGVVVGFGSEFAPPEATTFEPGQRQGYTWHWTNWLQTCDLTAPELFLPAGDYEIVFVSHVVNDQMIAARESLRQENYSLPAAGEVEAFREGSYLCSQWEMWHQHEPITCRPNAVVGFDLDEQARTATIPYNTALYSRDIDITFASEPIPASLREHPLSAAPQLDNPHITAGAELMCGETYIDSEARPEIPIASTWPLRYALPTPGEHVGSELWIQSAAWHTARIEAPVNPRIWIYETEHIRYLDPEGGTDTNTGYTITGSTIIGWVDTESASSSPIELDVYTGPAQWHLTVTDAQWCADREDSSDSPLAGSSMGLMGLVTAPATVTLDDERTDHDIVVWLRPDFFG